mmetsp:Transcript_19810/g.29407  ORF Transcript_19810/g.29407 Transcript_19810/m.29407 type:complete len:102 (-) Transcript_19810:836-1141(-)
MSRPWIQHGQTIAQSGRSRETGLVPAVIGDDTGTVGHGKIILEHANGRTMDVMAFAQNAGCTVGGGKGKIRFGTLLIPLYDGGVFGNNDQWNDRSQLFQFR